MRILTRTEAAEALSQADRITIVTHRRPDGDTLGSAALLCRGLRQLGKTANILENPEITPKYAHLHRGLTVPQAQPEDFLVAVDVASPGMLGEAFSCVKERIALRIDHHGSADSFTACELVEPEAAACGCSTSLPVPCWSSIVPWARRSQPCWGRDMPCWQRQMPPVKPSFGWWMHRAGFAQPTPVRCGPVPPARICCGGKRTDTLSLT